MKHLYKPVFFVLLLSILFLSCKKSSTTPAVVTFMKLDTNGKAISYNACFTSELIIDGEPQTQFASQGTPGQFIITLNQSPGNLKTGQVYAAETTNSLTTDSYATFNYRPNGGDGYSSSMYNPIGSVTLTEVTPTSIKGTFSTGVFPDYMGASLAYTIANGSFSSGASVYTVVIN